MREKDLQRRLLNLAAIEGTRQKNCDQENPLVPEQIVLHVRKKSRVSWSEAALRQSRLDVGVAEVGALVEEWLAG